MKKIEVYIDNQLADFTSENDIDITIERSVDAFEAKQSEFTYAINFPRTLHNEKIFKHIVDKMKINKFTDFYTAEVVINKTQVLRGVLSIIEINKRLIRGNIISDTVNFLALLGDKSLRDIESFDTVDFQGVETINDHVQNLGSIDLADIAFPLVGYGNFYYGQLVFDSLPDEMKGSALSIGQQNLILGTLFFTDYPPAVWLLTIIRKIFQDIGFVIDGEIFDDLDVQKILLLYTSEREPSWNWRYLANFEFTSGITIDADSDFDTHQHFLARYSYTAPTSGNYKLNLRLDGQKNDSGANDIQKRVVMVLQTSDQKLESPYYYIFPGNTAPMDADASILTYETSLAVPPDPSPFSISLINEVVSLEAGQTVWLCYYGGDTNAFPAAPSEINYIEFELTEILDQDEFLHIEKNLPDIKQIDFVRSFIKMFNLVTSINEIDKTIYFNRKSVFYKDVSQKVVINDFCDRNEAIEKPVADDQLRKVKYYLDEKDFFFKEDPLLFPKYNQAYDPENNIELIFSPTAYRLFWLRTGNSDGLQPIVLPSIASEDGINRNVLDAAESSPNDYDFAPRLATYIDIANYITPLGYNHRLFVTDFQGDVEAIPVAHCTVFDRSSQVYYNVEFANALQVWKIYYDFTSYNLQRYLLSPAFLAENQLSLTYNETWVDINTLKTNFYLVKFDNLAESHMLTVQAYIPENVYQKLTGEFPIELFYDIYYLQAVKKYDVATGACELELIKKI